MHAMTFLDSTEWPTTSVSPYDTGTWLADVQCPCYSVDGDRIPIPSSLVACQWTSTSLFYSYHLNFCVSLTSSPV